MISGKAWGFEDEIVNLEYCGKRMFLKEQFRCSVHHHVKKDEVLLVASGLVYFEIGDSSDGMSGFYMQDNDRIRVKPGQWHRFTGLRDSLIMEFSSHHEDEDGIRATKSGKLGADEYASLLSGFYEQYGQENILTIEKAKVVAKSIKDKGRLVGFCNGCFDLLHLGHVELLRKAKLRCEVLFVAVNSDKAVKALKGDNRPLVPENMRLGMVASCRFVDYVILVDALTCVEAVLAVSPDIYVTTTEHKKGGPEAVEVAKMGGSIETVEMLKGFNTSYLASTIHSMPSVEKLLP